MRAEPRSVSPPDVGTASGLPSQTPCFARQLAPACRRQRLQAACRYRSRSFEPAGACSASTVHLRAGTRPMTTARFARRGRRERASKLLRADSAAALARYCSAPEHSDCIALRRAGDGQPPRTPCCATATPTASHATRSPEPRSNARQGRSPHAPTGWGSRATHGTGARRMTSACLACSRSVRSTTPPRFWDAHPRRSVADPAISGSSRLQHRNAFGPGHDGRPRTTRSYACTPL